MHRRLYECLRSAIQEGVLVADSLLPPSRVLASELGIARNTVLAAYRQLQLEAYVGSRQGIGTRVKQLAPERTARAIAFPSGTEPYKSDALSARGTQIVAMPRASATQWSAFMPGVPDVSRFPERLWTRLRNACWRSHRSEELCYGYGGLAQLRQALSLHLTATRSVNCTPEQVLVTDGAHQAIDLITRLLGDVGDIAWMENPGYWGARAILEANGIRQVPVEVDAHGMRCLEPAAGEAPRFLFVTPSHQYPLGSVMPVQRRQELLALAHRHGSWVIEDDYDGEFRFSGNPVPAMQGLAAGSRVIYVGTFSKTLYPGLRMAYMVVPLELVASFRAAHAELYREGRLMTQATLAQFIAQGHFASHIRAMRTLYAQRREMLAHLIERRLGRDWMVRGEDEAGLHLVMRFPIPLQDTVVAREALARGIHVKALSTYFAPGTTAQQGLVLGYACVQEADMVTKFEALLSALRATDRTT